MKRAFTIVELLIVVVVIAILAAITVVAYNGITGQARSSAVRSSLSSAQKKLLLYKVENGERFPTTLTAVGIKNNHSLEYRYTQQGAGASFCLTVIDTADTSAPYYIDSAVDTVARQGRCTGHEDAHYATNYMPNSGFENEITLAAETAGGQTLEVYGGLTVERVAGAGVGGSYGLRVIFPSTPRLGGLSIAFPVNVGAPTKLAAMLFGRAITPGLTEMQAPLTYIDAGVTDGYSGRIFSESWTRLDTITTAAPSRPYAYVNISGNSSMPANAGFVIDAIMVVKYDGSGYLPSTTTYRDGDSAGWIWNEDGTSTGPLW